MDSTPAEVWRVLRKIDSPQPLHYAVVGPLDHVRRGRVILIRRSTSQAVWVELVGVEHMDGTLDAQVMQLTGNLQEQEVVHSEVLQHSAINPRLRELVLVLWQANVIQPTCHPDVVKLPSTLVQPTLHCLL